MIKHFFSGIKNPAIVSEIVVGLAAGEQLDAERLPLDALPAAVLLATIGLRSYQQQIVDNYALLLSRAMDAINDPLVTHARFWHPQLALVVSICLKGPRGAYTLDSLPEARYIFTLYEHLIEAEETELFPTTIMEEQ